jgi:hypothetical protein
MNFMRIKREINKSSNFVQKEVNQIKYFTFVNNLEKGKILCSKDR